MFVCLLFAISIIRNFCFKLRLFSIYISSCLEKVVQLKHLALGAKTKKQFCFRIVLTAFNMTCIIIFCTIMVFSSIISRRQVLEDVWRTFSCSTDLIRSQWLTRTRSYKQNSSAEFGSILEMSNQIDPMTNVSFFDLSILATGQILCWNFFKGSAPGLWALKRVDQSLPQTLS